MRRWLFSSYLKPDRWTMAFDVESNLKEILSPSSRLGATYEETTKRPVRLLATPTKSRDSGCLALRTSSWMGYRKFSTRSPARTMRRSRCSPASLRKWRAKAQPHDVRIAGPRNSNIQQALPQELGMTISPDGRSLNIPVR